MSSRKPLPPRSVDPYELLMIDEFAKIFEYIVSHKPPIQYMDLARHIDEGILFTKRRYLRMYEVGFRFRVTFNEKKLGITTAHVFLKGPYLPDPVFRVKGVSESLKWILRWQGNTVFPEERGVLMFYVPLREEIMGYVVEEIQRRLPVERLFETDITLGNKPELKYLYKPPYFNYRITNWEMLAEELMDAYKKGETPQHYLEYKDNNPVSIDLLDILILSLYQIDAMMSLQEMEKRLKKPVGKLRRHLKSHLLEKGVITGIRLKDFVQRRREAGYMVIVGKTEPYNIALFLDYMRRTFNLLSGAYNRITGEYLFIFAYTPVDNLMFTKYMAKPYIQLLGGDVKAYILSVDSIRSYSLPFLAFSRDEKFWDVDVNVINLMKEKLQYLIAQGA